MWLVLALGVVGSAVGAAAARLGVGNVVCQTLHGELMPGDGQPFGCHADPVGDITEIPEGVVPHPRDFFETFVRTREPAVLRGAVKLAGGVEGWTDDRLAGPEFGGLQIKLEGKREKREETQGALLGKLAMGRDTLGHFVNRTRRNSSLAERKLGGPLPDNETTVRPVQVGHVFESTRSQLEGYVVSQLPAPMSPDVHVPAVATCGSMATELLEANLWVSSGNTSSMLHRDADNVFNCVYKGSKVWTLVDPLETPRIPQAAEKVGEIGGVALVDPDRIDASTPQGLQLLDEGGVPYRRVTANAGDCVFLPWGYWHQVYSPPGRNIAVTLLYSVAHRFDDPDGECEPPPTPSVPAAAPTSASVDPSGASTIEPGGSAPSPPPPPLPIHGPMGPTRLRLAPWLEPLPLSEASIVWSYDGQGEMSMGNADPASFRLQTAMTAQLPRSAADLPARTGPAEAERLLADARLARSIAERVAAERGISAPSPADAYGESEDEMEGDGDGWEQAGLLADRAAAGSLDDEDDEDDEDDAGYAGGAGGAAGGLHAAAAFADPPGAGGTPAGSDEELDFLRLTASAADPDSWIAIDSSQQEQEAAAFAASVAMAAALGLTKPPIPYGPAEVRAMLEAKAGRALSPTEVKWMKEEYARVGVGLPMPWGGIVTEGRFRRAYTRELIQQHGRSDGGGEETDDDDDTAETAAADAKRDALKLGASGEQAEAAAERARAKWYRRMAARDNARRRTAQAAEEEAASLWRNALDPMGRGFITAIELLSVPSRAIAAELKMGVQFDPSNTEEWELYLQDGSAVTTLLRQHWASHAALTQSMAQMAQGSLAALRASDSSEAAIERVVQAAVAGGCGMLYIEQWRQGYLESLEGSDFVADLVSAEVVKVAAEAGVCRSGMASPPPLTRPKNLRENGDPSLPVYVMVAISEETLAVVLDRVAAMFSRELSRDPALQDIAKMSFAS
ncbi:hypothetical protein FNF29_03799 [Cafeteria roenbergensis]|uniref:JmjC domain-containing protein n=1 Tax=Cafeteria roenbergensis TaxID=33653 RepID=A0A5A8CHP9_CAFRO|nr:hypothetical protein FNF29_03799 [Cafeteria roenbergensis]|eukprot:KAA0152572.1 hypothetical protein FNF29_03799 [Cafeteria roenbergensis]